MADTIAVRDLAVRACIGKTAWNRPDADDKLQPVLVSVFVPYNVALAGSSDDLSHSLNYGALCKAVERCFNGQRKFASVEVAAEAIVETCLAAFPTIMRIRVRVSKTRAALQAKSVAVEIERTRIPQPVSSRSDVFVVEDLLLYPIIGVNPWEREDVQPVVINLELEPVLPLEAPFPYPDILRDVSDVVLKSSYLTIEAFVTKIAEVALRSCAKVSVRAAKPSALMFAGASEVAITRDRETLLYSSSSSSHRVAVAFGSNVGDRFANIETALARLEAAGAKILCTSFLYDTTPMYVEDQDSFVNGACLVETNLEPMAFLSMLKRVEVEVGRVPTFRNGPRAIDLDMVFWDSAIISMTPETQPPPDQIVAGDLFVPHERMQEREFVLRPLNDFMPDFIHPTLHLTVRELLAAVTATQGSTARRIIRFPSRTHSHVWRWGERTYIMATLNVTPDSFSDGGDNASLAAAVQYAQDAQRDGADILDIGGYSTRPGAQEVSEAEEISRVVPAVRAIRAAGVSIPISVDTFRASVAEQAVDAGANCINDVTALRHDPSMPSIAARLRVPVILMHSRGPADQNKVYSDVMQDVRQELGDAVRLALNAGVRRWNLIADPGIGFSKTVEGNTEMVRNLRRFTAREPGMALSHALPHPLSALPVLVGASRKSFLGKLVGRETQPKDRDFATAAAVVASVQQGCDIVRVHNVAGLRDAVKVADALWRRV
ncbi:Dihydropteroate synthase [Exidia glandulosa HHB12029]|uniref:Folic acid synthesis protein FOL1 n=1 Tax=Exidia glandulosa HHB12029 TaxID=1314781 RepID=A0A165K9R9_EXIGL|nr:Dihydropteroate synthase [Exidia glandulosa HHB12029]